MSITNIKPQDYASGKKSKHRKKASFRELSYKKQRGVVETRFGTIENTGLTLTHYRKDDTRFKYGLILELRQNIDNLLRLKVEKLVISMIYSTNSMMSESPILINSNSILNRKSMTESA